MRDGIATSGRPLDRQTRDVMEPRFGHDFSAVRVHTDRAAATAADRLGARAYTAGSHIAFARDEFRPATARGAHLLAHELAHTLQQPAAPSDVHRVGRPDDVAEHEAARAAADATRRGPLSRLAPVALSSDQPHVLRRAPATTWAGEFKPERYRETYDVVDAKAHTFRPGADVKIAFVANDLVDAKEIHFIQSADTQLNNVAHAIKPTVTPRMIPTGEPGEGLHLDAPASQASPFVDYQSGVHYSAAGQNFRRDAKTTDTPGFDVQDSDSASMTFQSAAVATDGTQKGVYYGAVQWGWTREPKQRPKMQDFRTVPWIVPGGSLFGRMAELFEASKTSQGDPTGPVPRVAVKFTARRTTLVVDPAKPKAAGSIDLGTNTQVEVLPSLDPTKKGWQNVAVVSGRHAGRLGWVHDPLADHEVMIPKGQKP